ncbi:hypothetical protein BD779DRAFT_1520648 [Infundibulicybe gibba]|nr:hypothetical protein BD779DRAFT_1520648 [Infundibulicybe gibba]
MPFPFTFRLSVPGLANPFSSIVQAEQISPIPDTPDFDSCIRSSRGRMGGNLTHRPSSLRALSSTAPSSRKRGWEPSYPEPSESTTTLASGSGYLDTPAKYREMAATNNDADDFHEELLAAAEDLPPPSKRRRGLAGSIVSTALSAALIGTAVGLTVYRLWRDRGKEPERLPPPPPYQQGEWIPEQPLAIQAPPTTPRRKTRHTISSASKRTTTIHRKPRPKTQTYSPPARGTSPTLFPPTQPEFNFGHQEDETPAPVEDQMDWIGDKLSMLIEEGKKALGREIVVMSDSKEDEVDDGSGAWEEELGSSSKHSLSRSSSTKRIKRTRSLAHSTSSHTTYPSPRNNTFDLTSIHQAPIAITPKRTHSRGISLESTLLTPSNSFKEDEQAWESPELRESMEKARARLLRARGS